MVCGLLVMAMVVVLAQLSRGSLGALAVVPSLILLLGIGFQVALWCYVFGARLAISVPVALTPAGVTLNLPQGSLSVPWAAVSHVSLRSALAGQVLRFHLHPTVAIDGPGVATDLSRRDLDRQVTPRRTVRIGRGRPRPDRGAGRRGAPRRTSARSALTLARRPPAVQG